MDLFRRFIERLSLLEILCLIIWLATLLLRRVVDLIHDFCHRHVTSSVTVFRETEVQLGLEVPAPAIPMSVVPDATSSLIGSSSRPHKFSPKVQKYYAVKVGRVPGIYYSWSACAEQVTGYKGAIFQSFRSLSEAEAFLRGFDRLV